MRRSFSTRINSGSKTTRKWTTNSPFIEISEYGLSQPFSLFCPYYHAKVIPPKPDSSKPKFTIKISSRPDLPKSTIVLKCSNEHHATQWAQFVNNFKDYSEVNNEPCQFKVKTKIEETISEVELSFATTGISISSDPSVSISHPCLAFPIFNSPSEIQLFQQSKSLLTIFSDEKDIFQEIVKRAYHPAVFQPDSQNLSNGLLSKILDQIKSVNVPQIPQLSSSIAPTSFVLHSMMSSKLTKYELPRDFSLNDIGNPDDDLASLDLPRPANMVTSSTPPPTEFMTQLEQADDASKQATAITSVLIHGLKISIKDFGTELSGVDWPIVEIAQLLSVTKFDKPESIFKIANSLITSQLLPTFFQAFHYQEIMRYRCYECDALMRVPGICLKIAATKLQPVKLATDIKLGTVLFKDAIFPQIRMKQWHHIYARTLPVPWIDDKQCISSFAQMFATYVSILSIDAKIDVIKIWDDLGKTINDLPETCQYKVAMQQTYYSFYDTDNQKTSSGKKLAMFYIDALRKKQLAVWEYYIYTSQKKKAKGNKLLFNDAAYIGVIAQINELQMSLTKEGFDEAQIDKFAVTMARGIVEIIKNAV